MANLSDFLEHLPGEWNRAHESSEAIDYEPTNCATGRLVCQSAGPVPFVHMALVPVEAEADAYRAVVSGWPFTYPLTTEAHSDPIALAFAVRDLVGAELHAVRDALQGMEREIDWSDHTIEGVRRDTLMGRLSRWSLEVMRNVPTYHFHTFKIIDAIDAAGLTTGDLAAVVDELEPTGECVERLATAYGVDLGDIDGKGAA